MTGLTLADVPAAAELEQKIRPILAGQHPAVQGATLASLLACWLAGHPASMRDELIDAHGRSVRQLVPLYECLLPMNQAAPRKRKRRQ
jgi:hypothetical protein